MLGFGTAGLEGHNINDRIFHYRDSEMKGVIKQIEDNKLSVMVLWEGCTELDFQWANKVIKEM